MKGPVRVFKILHWSGQNDNVLDLLLLRPLINCISVCFGRNREK